MFQYAGPVNSTVRYYLAQAERAFYVAFQAHFGQTDKGGRSYIYHPLSLCFILTGTPSDSPRLLNNEFLNQEPIVLHSIRECELMIAALLHDVVEDTPMTMEELRRMDFPDFSISLLSLLTHSREESYSAYIERIAANPYASLIKTADLLHNCNLNRLSIISENDLQRRDKYIRTLYRLWPVVQEAGIAGRLFLPEEFASLNVIPAYM